MYVLGNSIGCPRPIGLEEQSNVASPTPRDSSKLFPSRRNTIGKDKMGGRHVLYVLHEHKQCVT